MLEYTFKAIALNSEEIAIRLSGNLVLSNGDKIKEQISYAIKDYAHIQISATDVDDIDIAFIQILYAFASHQPSIEFHFELPNELRDLLKNAGYNFLLNR